MTRRALVTGASGLVGTALTRALNERGVEVVALAREQLLDPQGAAEGCDIAFHLAAVAAVEAADAVATFEVNVRATWLVLDACRAAGVSRAVLASSVHAANPQSVYGASKAAAEAVAGAYGASVLRLVNVYGDADRNASRLVPELLDAARAGRAARLRNDGAARHDFLHAEDAATALIAAAQTPGRFEARGQSASVRDVAELVRELAGSPEPEYGAGAASPLAPAALPAPPGWTPRVALRDGLARALRP